MACFELTANLDYLGCWDEILMEELTASLVAHGKKAKAINAESNLAVILNTVDVLAVALYNLELFPEARKHPNERKCTFMHSTHAQVHQHERALCLLWLDAS